MVKRLDGLRLDAVVSGDDEYGDVRNLSAARAHRGEGLVARRVEEDERVAVVFDARGSDVLGDAAGLFFGDVGFSDVVEERRLAVVDVAHDGDDRRARLKLSVAALFALFLFILGFEFFVGYRLRSLRALLRRGLFRGLRFGRLRRGFGGRRFFLRRSGGRSLRGEDEILFEGLAEYLENLLVGARRRGEHEPLHHQRLDRASGLFARERRHVGDGSALLHRDGRVGGYSLYLLARGLFLRLVQRLLHHRDEFFVYRAHMRFNADAEAREQLDHFGIALSELFSQIINSDFTHSHHSCHKSVCKFF